MNRTAIKASSNGCLCIEGNKKKKCRDRVYLPVGRQVPVHGRLNMDDKEKIKEEERKMRQLRVAVDLTKNIISQGEITYGEALKLVEALKSFAMNLFPEKEETFELIYRPRFKRVLEERYRL